MILLSYKKKKKKEKGKRKKKRNWCNLLAKEYSWQKSRLSELFELKGKNLSFIIIQACMQWKIWQTYECNRRVSVNFRNFIATWNMFETTRMVPSADVSRTANYRKKIWIERKEQRFFSRDHRTVMMTLKILAANHLTRHANKLFVIWTCAH